MTIKDKKHQCVFFKATFCVGVKTKTSNYKPCLYTGDPCEGVRSLPPQTKNPRYDPAHDAMYSTVTDADLLVVLFENVSPTLSRSTRVLCWM